MKQIQIDNVIYNVNTDFRTAIECNRIAEDNTIGDLERVLGIICTLYGAEALDHPNHYEKLIKWGLNYLSGGNKVENKEPDMDFIKDKGLIISSFKYDYKYNPYDREYLSWEEFYNDLNNLSSNVELGNCCVLNRARYWRNYDTSKIKDSKERKQAEEIKKYYALNKEPKKEFTLEEQNNMEEFYKQMGL